MKKQPVVLLDECELEIASQVAAFRCKRVLKKGLGRGHGQKGIGFEDRHLPGAMGEIALAKHLRLYWGGSMNDFGVFGDVGAYEVRGSWHQNAHLCVYESDTRTPGGQEKNPLVVLVTIKYPEATICGCMRAKEALGNDRYRELGSKYSRPNAQQWWVPQSDLLEL